MIWDILIGLIAFLIGGSLGYIYRKNKAEGILKNAERVADEIIEKAKAEGEKKKLEIIVSAKDEAEKIKNETDRQIRQKRSELQKQERRLLQRELSIEKRQEGIEKKEKALQAREEMIAETQKEIELLKEQELRDLERIASMTMEEAKNMLISNIEAEAKREATARLYEIEMELKEEADRKAREIVSLAIQRCASDEVASSTVTVVNLPSEEMKGRIIGREGRNIRTIEMLTGVDLIIDDTPEVVVLSSYDPIRREIARLSLEKLIQDGRIHPARIEEMVEKAQQEVESRIKEEGEKAIFEAKITRVHPEIVRALGRLIFRTSYGQNVLQHSREVSRLASMMASELGIDPTLAKRAGLLHDIGKALDYDAEGPHALLGAEFARKYNENETVVNAIASHHGEETPNSIEAVLVQAADAISAARPGARKETLEAYIKRIKRLEELAVSFEGVEKAYALQAGREIRVIVQPEKLDDLSSFELARELAKKIEDDLEYPGQIRVIVIRETRAVEYAR
ncbi:MAG TPA: ribonuclease Y [bacterium]|nr:ribonuclease Y [Dictyoglomota bacterium]HHV80868.1 ribonuclease Y [bacterium]HOP55324.1 ribonuclease Y [bacterium]